MKLPQDLLYKIHGDYTAFNYKDGVFVFKSLNDNSIEIVLKGFLDWATEKGLVKDNKIDISQLL